MPQIVKIPYQVKRECVRMRKEGTLVKDVYQYMKSMCNSEMTYNAFEAALRKWVKRPALCDDTLDAGTYQNFTAHDATVQVSSTGEIIQAWIKQSKDICDPEAFIEAISSKVEPYVYQNPPTGLADRMLEIPLFDMHWGICYLTDYQKTLEEILELIDSRVWDQTVIFFGQDFFHNDSIVNPVTTKGTVIEKVDMQKAVYEGQRFMYAIIDEALLKSKNVRVIYTPGNHDRSISWMFMQILRERYGQTIVDDSLEYRKCITYGQNSIMVTHGDAKRANPKNLAHVFPIAFSQEFANASVREVHAGHLHSESDTDIYGIMVRRLSSATGLSDWSNKEDFIGSHKRFMIFEWSETKLASIHYI